MKYLPYVHIRQGTASSPRFSHGNTLPLTQLPFGMAGFAPQTEVKRPGWFYHPEDRTLEGVRLTHQPSPWIGDYGALLFMPQAGKPETSSERRWSGYRPEEANLHPHYLKVEFLRSGAAFELAPTERGAAMRVAYARTEEPSFFSVLRVSHEFSCRVDAAARRVYVRTNSHSIWEPAYFQMYAVLEFDCPIREKDTVIEEGEGLHLALDGHEANIRLAISYISEEQAVRTLERELAGQTFDTVRRAAEEAWETLLSRVEVEAADDERLHTFYTCLYRMFLFPHKMYELDEEGRPIHFATEDGTVKGGVLYTDNGFWDTFRTVYPLFALAIPERYEEILDGLLQHYRDTGWLPKWPSMTETGCMPGTLIDAVLADAAVKGILKGDSLRTAFEGMLKHAEQEGEGIHGRLGLKEYLQYGYVPREAASECVNRTLDYAYGDFCISQIAGLLGETEVQKRYAERAQNYRRLFDPVTGFMRGRDAGGQMTETFDPIGWGGDYTEGGPWQNSFAVYHDVEGLAELYGGREGLLRKLDELFDTPPVYHVGGYGAEIHEMTEMAAVDFGQCAISNQPSFHLPYLYAALGQPEKAACWIEKMAVELFSFRPDGFPGDEDNGTMAGWYVFSCMGFYPLCPGKNEYVRGVRLVDNIRIGGKKLEDLGLVIR